MSETDNNTEIPEYHSAAPPVGEKVSPSEQPSPKSETEGAGSNWSNRSSNRAEVKNQSADAPVESDDKTVDASSAQPAGQVEAETQTDSGTSEANTEDKQAETQTDSGTTDANAEDKQAETQTDSDTTDANAEDKQAEAQTDSGTSEANAETEQGQETSDKEANQKPFDKHSPAEFLAATLTLLQHEINNQNSNRVQDLVKVATDYANTFVENPDALNMNMYSSVDEFCNNLAAISNDAKNGNWNGINDSIGLVTNLSNYDYTQVKEGNKDGSSQTQNRKDLLIDQYVDSNESVINHAANFVKTRYDEINYISTINTGAPTDTNGPSSNTGAPTDANAPSSNTQHTNNSGQHKNEKSLDENNSNQSKGETQGQGGGGFSLLNNLLSGGKSSSISNEPNRNLNVFSNEQADKIESELFRSAWENGFKNADELIKLDKEISNHSLVKDWFQKSSKKNRENIANKFREVSSAKGDSEEAQLNGLLKKVGLRASMLQGNLNQINMSMAKNQEIGENNKGQIDELRKLAKEACDKLSGKYSDGVEKFFEKDKAKFENIEESLEKIKEKVEKIMQVINSVFGGKSPSM